MHKPLDMAHILGSVAKWGIILVALGFSIALSFMFFFDIAPKDKPWFPWAALSLTEGGFVLWLAVFMLTRHHPFSKVIALVMTCACAACSLCVAGYEFYALLATKYDITQNVGVIQGVSILLEVIFCFHFVSLILDLFASYFSRPGNNFRNDYAPEYSRNLIPINSENRNLIPGNWSIEQLQEAHNTITGYLAAVKESGTADPLANRQLPRPQEGVSLAQMGEVLKEGVSSVTKKVKNSIKSTSKQGSAHGPMSTSTSENTSTSEEEINSEVE